METYFFCAMQYKDGGTQYWSGVLKTDLDLSSGGYAELHKEVCKAHGLSEKCTILTALNKL